MNNPFFKKKGPFKIDKLLKLANVKNLNNFKKSNINDIKTCQHQLNMILVFSIQKNMNSQPEKQRLHFVLQQKILKITCQKIVIK